MSFARNKELESSSSLITGLQRPERFGFSRSVGSLPTLNATCICDRFRGCLPDLSKRQWQLLAVFAVADFIAGIVYNIKGPFYPAEAEKKGVTSTEYGFVFGIFDLTKIFVCPIFGRHMSEMRPKRVFISSMMLIAICSVAFGLLDKIDNSTAFLTLSLIIRGIEAVGSAGFSTSSFCIIANEFENKVATTFASLETFFGIGLIVGPLIGGLFFQIGGYDAPFIITGVMLFTVAVILTMVMPHPLISPEEEDKSIPRTKGHSIFKLLKIPGVMLAAFAVFAAASSTGFLNSTLEPDIRQFNLSSVGIGIVFVIYGTVYAATAPIFGYICDRLHQPLLITLVGAIVNFFAFLIIGPAPFFQFEPNLWVSCMGLVLHGLGLGATFVSGFVLSLKYSIANGFPNNMATYGVVSGMWTSVLSIGMSVGPSLGGILLYQVGFRWGSLYVLISMLILIVLIISFLMKYGLHIKNQASSEFEPLLQTPTITDDDSSDRRSPSYGSS